MSWPRRSAALSALALVVVGLALAGAALATPIDSQPAPGAVVLPNGDLVRPNGDVVPGTGFRRARSVSRVETRYFSSVGLGRTMPYLVYLPPGYESDPDRSYPTIYLLHGDGGNNRQWTDTGILDQAERMIRSGEMSPVIIVMPEGERGYWVDHANNGPKWGTYVAVDLVRDVELNYRAIRERASRAIGGLSMGAHGAVQLSLNFPDTFGVVGAHSLVLRRYGSAAAFFGNPVQYAARDPMELVYSSVSVARATALWIDIGNKDPWAPLAEQFHLALNDLQIEHTWHEWSGDHSGTYWSAHTVDYLRFYDGALAKG